MLETARKDEIRGLVSKIDRFSERYQLSHATVAIEKLYKDKVQQEFVKSYAELKKDLKDETDPDVLADIFAKAKVLKKDSNKRIHISISYSEKLEDTSSRITQTQKNSFLISLPLCMTNIRNEDGTPNAEKYNALRKLMAHELGHIVLHSGIFEDEPTQKTKFSDQEEAEANYFAEELLSLRDKYGEEFMKIKSS